MLAFTFLMRFGFYPPEISSTVLNSDWFYRKLAPRIGKPILLIANKIGEGANAFLIKFTKQFISRISYIYKHPVTGPVTPGPAAIALITLLMCVLLLTNIF